MKEKIIFALGEIGKNPPTRELALARTKLEEALFWIEQHEMSMMKKPTYSDRPSESLSVL